MAPTTKAPTTMAPTTKAPTTMAPTTKAPTKAPTAAPNVTTAAPGCAKKACVAAMLSADESRLAIGAGETKECTLSSHKVVAACLGTKASFSCPANNVGSKMMPDFVTAQAVKCRACAARTVVRDLDPQTGEFWVALEWGPLMSDSGAFVETDVTSYTIHITDSNGRILSTVGTADKVVSTTSCCTEDLYSYSAAGTLPKGYSKFMIVPNVGPDAWLPMGILTEPIIDSTQGMATKVMGSFTIKVSNAGLFKTDPKINAALREAVADTISGVEKDNVRITNITSVRRLREDEGARRLAAHSSAGTVKVNYEIVLPDTYTGAAIKKSSISPTTLMKAINTRVAAKGVSGATVTEAPIIGELSFTSIGQPRSTGGALRSAPLGLAAVLVVAVTMLLSQ